MHLEDRGVVVGNVTDKYQVKNPVYRLLVNRFLSTVGSFYQQTVADNVLEVGAGEGELAARLQSIRPAKFVCSDISPKIMHVAKSRHASLACAVSSASELAFPSKSFDLVVACEVMEHLPDPESALQEIARVARRHVIVSVPREPIWRALNMARGSYLKDLGNTPGHLQHWGRRSFVRLVGKYLRVVDVRTPLPWTIVRAQVD